MGQLAHVEQSPALGLVVLGRREARLDEGGWQEAAHGSGQLHVIWLSAVAGCSIGASQVCLNGSQGSLLAWPCLLWTAYISSGTFLFLLNTGNGI